jgi:hypothetical protein
MTKRHKLKHLAFFVAEFLEVFAVHPAFLDGSHDLLGAELKVGGAIRAVMVVEAFQLGLGFHGLAEGLLLLTARWSEVVLGSG